MKTREEIERARLENEEHDRPATAVERALNGGLPDRLPAIPPNDYEGSVADWMVTLVEKGFWDGKSPEFHGDVWITEAQYNEMLYATEEGK